MIPTQTVVCWKVRCLHSETKVFFDRYLLLDWSTLTPDQESNVLTLLDRASSRPEMIHYRANFREIEQEELDRLFSEARWTRTMTVPEYFEDEYGNSMNVIGLAQRMTGQEYPILVGNPVSVLRIGPTGVQKKDEWSVQAANDIALFLQTVSQIAASEWLKSPLSLRFEAISTNLKEFPDINRIISFDSPGTEATRGVLMLIRLLISKDDVFNCAVNWYLKHAADQRKRNWVKERQKSFSKCRKSRSCPMSVGNYTRQQIIDTFMYGSGLIHRKSEKGCEGELKQIVELYGRERFVIVLNQACRDVCQPAFDSYHIINQDFNRWITADGCAGPDRINIKGLLG